MKLPLSARRVATSAPAVVRNALAATLTSAAILTASPIIAAELPLSPAATAVLRPAAAATAPPVKSWSVGNDLRLPDPRPGGRIVDAAGMLDSSSSRAISEAIRRIERDVDGSQVIVVTAPDVPAGKTPKQTANELFNYWGVGSMERENGVLVFVFRDARRVEIEVGLALDRRFDGSWCSSMLDAHVVPRFKAGEYGEGVLEGVNRIGERLRSAGGGAVAGADDWSGLATLAIGGLGVGVPLAASNYKFDRDRRKCEQCGEVVAEPNIGAWNTTISATNVNAGERRRSYACQACGHEGELTGVIPKYDSVRYGRDGRPHYYNRPSSSSSRSGGSSSGRGGGGASW